MNTLDRVKQLINFEDYNGALEMMKDVPRYEMKDPADKVKYLAKFSLFMDGNAVSEHIEILDEQEKYDERIKYSKLFSPSKYNLYFYDENNNRVIPVGKDELLNVYYELQRYFIPKTW